MQFTLPRRRKAWRAGASMLLAAFMLLPVSAAAVACERPLKLRFSLIPQGDFGKDVAAIRPLLDALEESLGMPVETVQPSSYGAVIEGLLAGAVDVARLGPASYIAAKRQDARITAFASYASKKEVFQEEGAHYHSLLIVRRDSGVASVEALRGKRLALVDPDSTSGALIPRRVIGAMVKGPLEGHFSRVSYSGAHHLSALAVVNGQVDAAFVGSTNLSELVAKGQAKPEDFRILWRSAPIPRDPFVFRGQLCADIRDKIRAVFLRDHGRGHPDVLNNLKAVRFVPIGDSDYQILRDLS